MTDASTTPPGAGAPATLAETLDRELEGLARELTEIEMLVGQSRTEAGRHEQKRAQAAERLAGLGAGAPPADLAEANAQLVTLTRRAAVMEAQLDVLAGKQKTLERYRDGLARVREAVGASGADAAGETGAAAIGADDGARCRSDRRRGRRARRRPGDPGRPGGPPPRHRPGDARRAGPEPDEHRAPGPDRGAPPGARPGGGARPRSGS